MSNLLPSWVLSTNVINANNYQIHFDNDMERSVRSMPSC